ncbi:short chain dehydrogenase [Mycena vitilis]|nr:short chain dehydrogenase [Mycena vitilis]
MSAVRTIFVTGANQGLGLNTVNTLSKTPNVLVFMCSRKLPAAEEALAKFASQVHESSTVVPVQLDITDTESIKAAHAFVVEYLQKNHLSGLDVLINNAAVIGPAFQDAYAVNVFGTVAITEAMRPLLSTGGAILNISSSLGSLAWHTERPPPPLFPAYSSSKSALNSLTLQWAIKEEEKGDGVRVVCVLHCSALFSVFVG